MQEVGCPEPASAVALMEWMRNRLALSASNPIRSLVMKPSLGSCVIRENGNENSRGSYYESRSFSNKPPTRQAVHPLTGSGTCDVQMCTHRHWTTHGAGTSSSLLVSLELEAD